MFFIVLGLIWIINGDRLKVSTIRDPRDALMSNEEIQQMLAAAESASFSPSRAEGMSFTSLQTASATIPEPFPAESFSVPR